MATLRGKPASVFVRFIEAFLLTQASASFDDYEVIRRSVRILSTLTSLAEDVVADVTVNSSSREYIRLRLDAFRQDLFLIFEAHRYTQIVLNQTRIGPLACRVFLNSPRGLAAVDSLRKMSLEITKLVHNDTFKTITSSKVYDAPSGTARTLLRTRAHHAPGLLKGQLTPAGNAYSVRSSEIGKDDKVFLIMGDTGSGKSTFINTILGRPLAQITNTLEPCTRSVQAFRHVAEDGSKTVVIDTPGFDESCVHDADIINSIAHWMNNLYRNKVKPCGVLFLQSLSANRVGSAQMKNMLLFAKLSGKEVFANMAIVGTMVDQVDERRVQSRLDELAARWQATVSVRPHVVTFENTAVSAWDILGGFHNPSPLLISKEMVAEKKPLVDTTVGAFLLQVLQDMMKKIRPATHKVLHRWYYGTNLPQAEEDLRRLGADIKRQIQVLLNAGRSPVQDKNKKRETDLRPDSLASQMIQLSQLHSQLTYIMEFAPSSTVPQLSKGAQYALNLLLALQKSRLIRPSIVRFLHELCHLLSVTLDAAMQPTFDDPWPLLISVLNGGEQYTRQIASTKVPDLEAYGHLALCSYTTNEVRNFLEVDTKIPAVGRPMPSL